MKPEGFTWEGTGFSFDSKRQLSEPVRAGEFATFSFPELRRIEEVPAQIVFSDDIENVFINKRMLWGTSETVASVPVSTLVRRQFTQAVSEHFHPLVGDQQPAIRVFVDILGIILTREEGTVKSQATMRITIRDVAKDAICHEKIYRGKSEMPWDGGALIPDSVYRCIQEVAAEFLRDIAKDRTLIARLEGVTPDAKTIRKPSFRRLDIKPKNDAGVIQGACVLACNDWDECRAANWMRAQLERRSENQLGIEASRVRVIYESSSYDGEKKEWSVSFSAFARSEMVLDYDATTKSGTCIVDFGLMGTTAEKAAEALKNYVMQEMDKRAGAQQTGTEGAKAQVRFDDFKTDQRYSLSYCAFHAVY
ncbi:MAG: hypothetical protein ACI4RD_08285 [Kiritimatiellia bacterium]